MNEFKQKMASIRDADISADSIECKSLSGLLLTYVTDNFVKAYKNSPYINKIIEDVKYTKVIDDSTKSAIRPVMVFVSEKDIKEYYVQTLIPKYRTFQLSDEIKDCKVKKVLYINDVPLGFLIGDISNSELDIRYLIVSPELRKRQFASQFWIVCMSDLVNNHNITRINIDVDKDYIDVDRALKFAERFKLTKDTSGCIFHLNIEQ